MKRNFIPLDVRILDRRLKEDRYKPLYATDGSAALDLRMCSMRAVVLKPGETIMVQTGLAVHIKDPNFVGIIAARSGLSCRHGIGLANGIGVIDSDYTGQIVVGLRNYGDTPYGIGPMERIAQFMVMPVWQMALREVEAFSATKRGEGGFGSTGTHSVPNDTTRRAIMESEVLAAGFRELQS